MRGLTAQARIGSMDKLVAFRTPTYTKDGFGAPVRDVDGSTPTYYRAMVKEISGAEKPEDTPQDKVTKIIQVTMRSLGVNNPKHSDLVLYKGEEYDIRGIVLTTRDRFMIIDARLITTGV